MSFIVKVEHPDDVDMFLNVETGWEEEARLATHFQLEGYADACVDWWESVKSCDALATVICVKDTFTHPSLSVIDAPEYAVVTSSDEHGYGVFSWHVRKQEAEHNARVTGGQVVPVDSINGDVIIPPLATKQAMKGIRKLDAQT